MRRAIVTARFLVGVACLTTLISLLWLLLWVTVVPLSAGWSPVAVLSGSMEPAIDNGDIVITTAPDRSVLGPGAVIVFDNPAADGQLTHRIVAVDPDGNYVTRGDANARADSTPVRPETVNGVGHILVPAIGTPFAWAHHGMWLHLGAAVLGLAATVWASRWAIRRDFNPWRSPAPPALVRDGRRPLLYAGPAATLIVLALVAGTIDDTQAAFAATTDSATNSWATDTLDPPSSLGAVASGNDIDLTWTATPDAWADGYNIYRSTTAGGPYTFHDSVVGQGTTAYTDVGANAAAPLFETVTTATNNGTSVVVSKPAGTVDGDLLVAFVAGEDNAATLAPPGGWTEIFQVENSNNFVLGAWYRIASGEPASFTFTSTLGHAMNAAVLRYSNAHPTSPIDASAAATAFGQPTAPDITTTVANTTVLRVGSLEDSTVADIDYPAGTTGRVEVDIDPGQVTAVADAVQAVAGSTGTAAFTGSSDDYVAATIALRSAGGSGYYYVVESYGPAWTSVYSNEATAV